ncbi:class I SAM-dependent DNA methyltransferase [Natrinema salaciae]|uniref:site-specific DNA-methyltransferase (adenine-specific) n=1 Tax=Natrinema salaciae TaxID=1186196 RepID=A0A1H9NJ98_9EURY|nr:class I SAM-dependent DNA methyltransferase [Natrinema salaciae]SER35735.1 N-6 DNA Methylase [Natrinema salaciae]
MQTALTYRTNRDLFSNHYLDEHLPETDAWDEVSDETLREAYEAINELWEREKTTAPKRNESQLEETFIRPLFRTLGIPFEVEESTSRTRRRPDYGFFETEDATRRAFERREEGGDFYEGSVAVADAKRWGRPLDTRGSGEHDRDFENPSYQIHVYLQETPARWGVLTDGKKWRLYYAPTSHRLDSYYEIDLPTVLETGDLEAFKYFYLFFRHEAFLEDAGGDSFLDDVYDESTVFAQELGADLQDNIYEAITVLSEGFLQYPDNDLTEDDLDLIHDSSLVYLYRLIFVLYAESEGRDLLDTNNEIYEQSYSLNSLKQEVAEELDSADPTYRDWQNTLQARLDELFMLIDEGSKSRGIPEEELHIPAYNGGLFRTDPEDDSREATFLATHDVGDASLARVIELLTRSENAAGDGTVFVDYSSLDVRHLGSVYEGLLEYQLAVADEPLTLDDCEYRSAAEGDDVVVQNGDVYLTTGSGERKATGSYYTPEYVVEYIVENTLEPLVDDIRADLDGRSDRDDRGFGAAFAERVFDLKILDPAMGSGHFLTSVIDYLAREIIDAQEKQAAQQGIETVDEEHDINWARRQVAQRCIYGVDLNPLAVELAKVSLWLRTLAAEQPLAFLDHHLKTGNSLVGSDIEEIEELDSTGGGDGHNASLADFGVARKGTIEQLMRIYEAFIAIENQELADVKEIESKYDEFERNELRQRLEAMANVHTADAFGLDGLPSDAYERMAAAMEDDDEWERIERMQWFQDAQQWADDDDYFHWSLAFPEVFYDTSGTERETPGFDAVVGNPPYLKSHHIPDGVDTVLRTEYETAEEGAYDIYVPFVELANRLRNGRGRVGVIVPNKFFEANYGAALRNYLVENDCLDAVVNFGEKQVFDGVSTYTCVVFLDEAVSAVDYLAISDLTGFANRKPDGDVGERQTYGLESLGDRWNFVTGDTAAVMSKLADKPTLGDASERIFKGLDTGMADFYAVEKRAEHGDTYTVYSAQAEAEIEIETRLLKPLLKGKDIESFRPDYQDRLLFFPYETHTDGYDLLAESTIESTYPHAYEYMKQHESELRQRQNGAYDDDEWYRFTNPRNLHHYDNEKICSPYNSFRPAFIFDTDEFYFTTGFAGAYGTITTEQSPDFYRAVTAILNSTVTQFVMEQTSTPMRGNYFSYEKRFIKHIPLPIDAYSTTAEQRERIAAPLIQEFDAAMCEDGSEPRFSETVERFCEERTKTEAVCYAIADLCTQIGEMKEERHRLNGDVLDYLGTYDGGEQLSEVAEYQPPSGVADSILSETAESRDNLRVGDVRIRERGSKLRILATARYKPETPDEYETDRWGYTETDYLPAMDFVGLEEVKRNVITEFVPKAVANGDGFADFRETATKTNSIVDRIGGLTLPNVADVASGLNRYLRTKRRDEELGRRLESATSVLDDVVYTLYGLSDEDVETVESTVAAERGK